MKSTNPFLTNNNQQDNTFQSEVMDTFSAKGALNKTLFGLLYIIALTVVIMATPLLYLAANLYLPIMIISLVVIFMMSFAIRKDIRKAKTYFWIYATLEAILLSTFVATMNYIAPGVGFSALIVTFFIVLFMYFLYQVAPNLINTLTPVFMVVVSALFFLVMIDLFVGLFGASFLPYDNIAFIVILTVISSFSIAVDFRQIDVMERLSLPKEYEYLGALGLLISIIWTYINVVNLLARLRD